MTLLERLRYALYLAVVVSALGALSVALLASDALSVLPSSAFDTILGPTWLLAVYSFAFLVSPYVARRFPISRRSRLGDK